MSVPWRFILALPLGLILSISVFIGFLYTQLGVPTHMSQWIFDITQKKERFAANVSGPRVFVVAGSSALFSINAQLIQQQTGCPTINMGTHAGLFLDYHLYELKKIVRPGDTVLFAWEYEVYLDEFTYSSETSDDYILARDPEYFRQMSLPEKIAMATRIEFKRLQKGWSNRRHAEHVRPPAVPYSPYTPITPGIDCLDDNGDEVFNSVTTPWPPRPETQVLIGVLVNGIPSERTGGFEALADFIQWAQAHHITVLATFPAVVRQPAYDGPNGQKAIAMITRFYTSHGVPVIGSAKEVMLPLDQFYDTMYHLIHEATLERTARLIPELQPYLHPK